MNRLRRVRFSRALCAAGVVLLVGLLAGVSLYSAEPAEGVVTHPGLTSATDAAARDESLVLVVFGSRRSSASRILEEHALTSPAFLKKVGRLHLVRIDVNDSPEHVRTFRVNALPDLVLMTPQMQIVARSQDIPDARGLVEWIQAGRARAAKGLWEGTAIDHRTMVELEHTRDAEGLRKLVRQLGVRDGATRNHIEGILKGCGGSAVEPVLQGLEDPYLGIRVGAGEVWRSLAPDAPQLNPWADLKTRKQQVDEIRKWWKKTGKLPPAGSFARLDPAESRSVEEAIRGVLSPEPVRRTRGMSALVNLGNPVLPRLRRAIAKCIQGGDQDAIAVLEDVRWAILIPDDVESKLHVRRHLARGTSEQRCGAAGRLGKVGRAGLLALRELVDDADPLVAESAVQALTGIKGGESLAAMAVLLESRNAQLRTVAAQSLGRSKNVQAGEYLARVVNDPDEGVACVAIAGLEEIGAKGQGAVLISALKDKRWRVRAAAAEVIGEMKIKKAVPEMEGLLNDEDPFVVKNALVALRASDQRPPMEKVRALVKRLPDLTRLGVEFIIAHDSPETLKVVESIYDESDPGRHVEVLQGLTEAGSNSQNKDDHWKSILTKAASSKDPAVRLKLLDILDKRSVGLTCAFVSGLLADENPDVRSHAAAQVIRVVSYHWGLLGQGESISYYNYGWRVPRSGGERKKAKDFGILRAYSMQQAVKKAQSTGEKTPEEEPLKKLLADMRERMKGMKVTGGMKELERGLNRLAKEVGDGKFSDEELVEVVRVIITQLKGGSATIRPEIANARKKEQEHAVQVRKMHEDWHELLSKSLEKQPDVRVAVASYLTGDSRTDLPLLTALLENPDKFEKWDYGCQVESIRLILNRLPWPEASDWLTRAADSTVLYRFMLLTLGSTGPEVREFLTEPERVVAAMEKATAKVFSGLLSTLSHNVPKTSPVSLYADSKVMEQVVPKLCASEVPSARALGVYLRGTRHAVLKTGRKPDEDLLAELRAHLSDRNKSVRLAAVLALQALLENDPRLESELTPMLSDPDANVAGTSAVCLLSKPLRQAAEVDSDIRYLRIGESATVSRPDRGRYSSDEGPPPKVLPGKPAYLEVLRERLQKTRTQHLAVQPWSDETESLRAAFVLLLAQYGDFSGLEQELERWRPETDKYVPDTLLVAIGLTGDNKYLVAVEKSLERAESEWTLRELLKWLRGNQTTEARRLRREINRRMRQVQS